MKVSNHLLVFNLEMAQIFIFSLSITEQQDRKFDERARYNKQQQQYYNRKDQ